MSECLKWGGCPVEPMLNAILGIKEGIGHSKGLIHDLERGLPESDMPLTDKRAIIIYQRGIKQSEGQISLILTQIDNLRHTPGALCDNCPHR
jgi:hypothetical protein